MSTLDALLARSRTPGRFVERRSFTLSREKAIEKQREFALRHPRQYLLELVQAAVFSGATYLAIDTRPQSLLVAWVGGKAMLTRELENLFDYLFADRGDPRWRHLVQLAIGVNALLQRSPRMLRIESGDGQRAFRMDLDPSGRATIGQPTEPINGTYLFAENSTSWFSRFASSGPTEEQLLVEARCLYTPIPILLNGIAPFGYRGSRHIAVFGAKAWEPFDQEGRRGVVALHASPDGPRGFRMVVGGVWISTLPLDVLADRPLYGVICDDGLRKTADQSDIVQDQRYIEMLHAVQPIATRLIYRLEGPSYRPPALPPIPAGESAPRDEIREVVSRVEAEPLPDPIPMLRPRYPMLKSAIAQPSLAPVFTVTPTNAVGISGPSTAPDRFPWKILILTDGQLLTLGNEMPNLQIHRLTSKADVDFVRRVVDRRVKTRETSVDTPGGRVVVALHLEGPIPDWGPGVPFCVLGPTRDPSGKPTTGVVEHGGIEGHTVRILGGGRLPGPTRGLEIPFALPNVSLRIHDHSEGPGSGMLVEAHLRAALEVAHRLALPPDAPPEPLLLAELLAAMGVPQFVQEGGAVRTEVGLPLGWPTSAQDTPLAMSTSGPVTVRRLTATHGTGDVLVIEDLSRLLALDGLERRLGYGHLSHPELEAQPLFGAGRFGDRWVWLENEDLWRSPALQQLVWVGATFSPRQRAEGFPTGVRPWPELVGAVRAGVQADRSSYERGWQVLLAGLRRVEAERRWAAFARPPITVGRVEGMGRLALIHIARLLGVDDEPLLVPSDGGGRRSLREIREHPAARVVARRGVRLAEPWTFALTCDELHGVAAGASMPRLRYDDAPQVWRSLPETDRGWLVRHEVRQGGLRGWLGLRSPHDGTAGVLLRTTGQLIGLSEIERTVPCHGLLWSEDGAPTLSTEQRRLAQLAGLKLYQELVGILDRPQSQESAEAARRYAIRFVWKVWSRTVAAGQGPLQGTALELARRLRVGEPDSSGEPSFGTFEQWLATPPEQRPAIEEIDLEFAEERAAPLPRALPELDPGGLSQRLVEVMGIPLLSIAVVPDFGGPGRDGPLGPSPGWDFVWIEPDTRRDRVIVGIDARHPAIKAALERPGREREILMLELTRQLCTWASEMGVSVDLCRAQLVLLAQRFGAG